MGRRRAAGSSCEVELDQAILAGVFAWAAEQGVEFQFAGRFAVGPQEAAWICFHAAEAREWAEVEREQLGSGRPRRMPPWKAT